MSLASSLPITLTDGAVMGRYWRMHISSNLISCLKRERENGSSCGNNDIMLYVHVVAQPNQPNKGLSASEDSIEADVEILAYVYSFLSWCDTVYFQFQREKKKTETFFPPNKHICM